MESSFAFDTFDGAKPRFLNRGKKRRSVSTLSPSAVLGALSLSKGIPGLQTGESNGLIQREGFSIVFFNPGFGCRVSGLREEKRIRI